MSPAVRASDDPGGGPIATLTIEPPIHLRFEHHVSTETALAEARLLMALKWLELERLTRDDAIAFSGLSPESFEEHRSQYAAAHEAGDPAPFIHLRDTSDPWPEPSDAIVTLSLDVPEAIVARPRGDTAAATAEARFVLAGMWFDQGRIGSGRAASLIGISRVEFLCTVGSIEVSAIQGAADDLRALRAELARAG